MKKSKFLLVAITSSLISSAQSADFNEEFKKDLKSTRSSVSTGIDFNEKDQSNIYKESISNLHIQSKADIGVSGLKGLILNNYEPAILTLASLYKLGELIDQDLDKSIILYKKLPKNPDALISLGAIYHSQGEFDEASKYYNLAKEAGHPFAQRNIEQLKLDSE
jgi:TPR repeat protein